MITSKTPWTTSLPPENARNTYIKDASGRLIGAFSDYRDAELVIKHVNNGTLLLETIVDIADNMKDDAAGLEKALSHVQS